MIKTGSFFLLKLKFDNADVFITQNLAVADVKPKQNPKTEHF
jgi:hypothetical protein